MESWAMRASWPFYKELFSDYSIFSNHGHWTLWSYTGTDANVVDVPVSLSVNRISDQQVEICLHTDAPGSYYVDIAFDYSNDFVMNLYRLLCWRKAVFIRDTDTLVGDGYYLRSENKAQHVLIHVTDGTGKIILNGQPMQCTELTVENVSIQQVIADPWTLPA